MDRRYVAGLVLRRDAFRRAWTLALSAAPVTGPLARPEALQLSFDETLHNFFTRLQRRAREQPPGFAAAHSNGARGGCLCGLNPWLAYYRAGASALASITREEVDPALTVPEFLASQNEALVLWQRLARREVQAFCDLCQTEVARGDRPRETCVRAK